MRIIAGEWRGRALLCPSGGNTRPTSDRARQALFDMITHAPWARENPLRGSMALDAFAGTGAIGLEALSRGAGHVVFMEQDHSALATLRLNVARCGAAGRADIVPCDTTRAPDAAGRVAWAFLDPPYGRGLVPRAIERLDEAGWIGGGTILVIETAREERIEVSGERLADRIHGAARIAILRL